MKKSFKSYLTIPVFLGVLALTGQVSADETEVLVVEEPRTQVEPVAAEVVEPQEATEEATPLEIEEVVVETPVATEDSVEEVVLEQSTNEETKSPEQVETVTEVPTVEPKPASLLESAVPEVAEETSTEVSVENAEQTPVLGVTDSGETVHTYLAGASSSALVTNQVSSTGVSIRYERQVPTNTEILYAIWSDKSGQDDLKWYVSDAVGAAYVEFKNHKDYGRYHLHTYARTNGQMKGLLAQTFNRVDPTAPKTQSNAKVELVDYAETKTDFTVKVSGQADTTPINKVAVAVWSQDKGQDDLKWYTPTVTNNQANVKVNIANHSNTSDKYTVHVYTTYADGQTVGTNLGSHQITKPIVKQNNAKVEIVDYAEDKTNFTVKVSGQKDTADIKHVGIAVWSQDKGQDDLKWYQPTIANNQSSVNIDIANHSNTSDKYVVHAYTTYANGQTIGTNLGSLQITKPIIKKNNAKIEVVDYAENKTDFTVKVTGQEDTETIKEVRVAVWSQDKGQDDLKWYQPTVTDNQSSVKVDIANHSNTSDKYNVRVQTTYVNGQTVDTDLGAYQIKKPVVKQHNAKVELVDYAEDKTDFTVKVSGQEDTVTIKEVRVAVWSQDKGQDDLKWYQPTVSNGQSSLKVNIANHSNTSDKYIVHVYTTYADGKTVGTNLGSHQIVKPTPKTNALIEVSNYKEKQTYFTVDIKGQADTAKIKEVRVAVWSEDKGQDDLNWYQPTIQNNQGSAKISIANHSNKSDNYRVNVYTTYEDGQTVMTDLGSYKITKPNLAEVYGTELVNQASEGAKKVLSLAGELLGVQGGQAAHTKLVDDYNAVRPLPVGYKVSYKDDWCDVFTTVIFQRAGLSHLIGRECGVERHIGIFKNLGIWQEDGNITPKTGDIITFNWDQNYQANDGWADHIGIVSHVENGFVHTIEGNGKNEVVRRTYKIGHGNIRGYAKPRYI